MTKQYLRQYESVEITGCKSCSQHDASGIFEICKHKQAQYIIGAGEVSQHTCQHMRSEYGHCGPSMKLR